MADLAICIVTLVRRREFYARLMRCLQPQLTSRVQVYTLEDAGAEKIGEKRQRLLEAAANSEQWLCFVDDDDLVAETYCSDILGALDQNPDVVGFRLRYYEDGKFKGDSLHSVQAKKWRTEMRADGTCKHFRTPNHLNPVRCEMAQAIGFKPRNEGEDADYSERLFKTYPRMTEVFIDRFLYSYFYRSPNKRVEAPGIAVPDPVFA